MNEQIKPPRLKQPVKIFIKTPSDVLPIYKELFKLGFCYCGVNNNTHQEHDPKLDIDGVMINTAGHLTPLFRSPSHDQFNDLKIKLVSLSDIPLLISEGKNIEK